MSHQGYNKNKIKYVSAQPAIDYYVWQVEVMINNFIKYNINYDQINIILATENGYITDNWKILMKNYELVKFFIYEDNRIYSNYIPSIRPNILKQHWLKYPELKNDIIFYHDSDMIFTNNINWNLFIFDDYWYGSNVNSYISYDYIISKGNNTLYDMIKIIDINEDIIKYNNNNCIGAQILMKNVDWKFWNNVERDSENLYTKINEKTNNIQIWCSDMWSLLWNAWKLNIKTIPHNEFNFTWGNSLEDEWYNNKIFHNAGVVNDYELFYKANYYDKLPYKDNLIIKDNTASKLYWNLILEIGDKSLLK